MEPTRNPFQPTFGKSPAVLAGREQLIDDFSLALAEGPGNPLRTSLISGARGIGKTVILNEFENAAHSQGWVVLRSYVGDSMISDLVDTAIPRAYNSLDYAAADSQRRITGVSAFKVGVRTEIMRTRPEAQRTLQSELHDLASHLQSHGTGILITVDEVQSADPAHLHELATAVQDLNRDDFDIAFAAAGLPSGIEDLLQLDGTTFLRRAERVHLTRLDDDSSQRLLRETSELGGRPMTPEAAALAAQIAQGYPYLLQVAGSVTWARARVNDSPMISENHVAGSRDEIVRRMGTQVHAPSLRTVPPRQMEFLQAMAVLGGKEVPISVIAEKMGTTTTGVSGLRRELIYRELIEPSSYGKVRFTLPYLAEFLASVR